MTFPPLSEAIHLDACAPSVSTFTSSYSSHRVDDVYDHPTVFWGVVFRVILSGFLELGFDCQRIGCMDYFFTHLRSIHGLGYSPPVRCSLTLFVIVPLVRFPFSTPPTSSLPWLSDSRTRPFRRDTRFVSSQRSDVMSNGTYERHSNLSTALKIAGSLDFTGSTKGSMA